MDIYASLPPIKGQRVRVSSDAPFIVSLIRNCLPTVASETFATRLEGKVVQLDNPQKESNAKREHDEKRRRRAEHRARRKADMISVRRATELGAWEFDERLAKWETFWPIHQLWLGYISELLDLPSRPSIYPESNSPPLKAPDPNNIQPKLVKADFHGCIVTVTKCRSASRIGCTGIVMQETANTFKVVTKADTLKVIPKQGTVFAISLPYFAPSQASKDTDPRVDIELYGNQFRFRAADRASRKFKVKETTEL